MPKLGRRSDLADVEFYNMNNQPFVNERAPFGTQDTPTYRVKIIGGKAVHVKEENNYWKSPRYGTPAEKNNIGQASQRGTQRASVPQTPSRLAPLVNKPTQYNPWAMEAAVKKAFSHQVPPNHQLRSQSDTSLNPHPRIPPINTTLLESNPRPSDQPKESEPLPLEDRPGDNFLKKLEASMASDNDDLTRHLPTETYLPREPVSYSRRDELTLRQRVQDDLPNFDPKLLKDLYLELSGYDRTLSGYVNYADLSFTLMRRKVSISPINLKLIAVQYVNPAEFGRVNYEKILSFIASSIQMQNNDVPPLDLQPQQEQKQQQQQKQQPQQNGRHNENGVKEAPPSPQKRHNIRNESSQPYNPITLQDSSPPKVIGDNAKLYRLIDQQLEDAPEDVNFERAWQVFGQHDRDHRNRMSRDQIKQLSRQCAIPLQESIMNQIIDRCDNSNGQYDWGQYLEFIERVQPTQTGLQIFPNKTPREYVKHYPEPTSDWPRGPSTNVSPQPSTQQDQSPRRGQGQGQGQHQSQGLFPDEYSVTPQQRGNPNPQGHVAQSRRDPLPAPRNDNRPTQKERAREENGGGSRDLLQVEMDRIQKEYEGVRKKMLVEEQKKPVTAEPWFDRFMCLANALYKNDYDASGHLEYGEARWLVDKYNDMFDLQIPTSEVEKAFKTSSDNGQTTIDPLLKILSLTGQ